MSEQPKPKSTQPEGRDLPSWLSDVKREISEMTRGLVAPDSASPGGLDAYYERMHRTLRGELALMEQAFKGMLDRFETDRAAALKARAELGEQVSEASRSLKAEAAEWFQRFRQAERGFSSASEQDAALRQGLSELESSLRGACAEIERLGEADRAAERRAGDLEAAQKGFSDRLEGEQGGLKDRLEALGQALRAQREALERLRRERADAEERLRVEAERAEARLEAAERVAWKADESRAAADRELRALGQSQEELRREMEDLQRRWEAVEPALAALRDWRADGMGAVKERLARLEADLRAALEAGEAGAERARADAQDRRRLAERVEFLGRSDAELRRACEEQAAARAEAAAAMESLREALSRAEVGLRRASQDEQAAARAEAAAALEPVREALGRLDVRLSLVEVSQKGFTAQELGALESRIGRLEAAAAGPLRPGLPPSRREEPVVVVARTRWLALSAAAALAALLGAGLALSAPRLLALAGRSPAVSAFVGAMREAGPARELPAGPAAAEAAPAPPAQAAAPVDIPVPQPAPKPAPKPPTEPEVAPPGFPGRVGMPKPRPDSEP